KKKGEQPGINVAAASDDAHETIKWSEIIQVSTNSSLNGLFGHAFQHMEGKESGENYVSVTNLTGGMKMIRQRRPPRRFNKIIKDTFLCRVTQQTFGQPTALERRSWKEDRPHTPAYASNVCLLSGSVDARYATRHQIPCNLFHECASAIFPREPFAREQGRTQKPAGR